MKAAVLEKLDSPLSIKNVELTDLQFGQVLVKVLVSGLCGSQLQEISGYKGNGKFLPHLMGHEGCGIVEQIGLGVTRVKPGDKVVMHWRVGAGIDAPFPKYVVDGKTISSGKVTTLSEYSIVSENRLTVVPAETDPYFCALLGCGLTTALGTINNEANLKFGESVLILGCGGVGLNLILGATMARGYPIVGVDVSDVKGQIARDVGATHYVNISNSENFPHDKFDVIIDTTGNSSIIERALPLLSDRGRFILVGQPKPKENITIKDANFMFGGNGKTILATQGGKTAPNEDIPRYAKLHNNGVINIRGIVTHLFKLDQINDAIDLLRSGTAGRIMIEVQ